MALIFIKVEIDVICPKEVYTTFYKFVSNPFMMTVEVGVGFGSCVANWQKFRPQNIIVVRKNQSGRTNPRPNIFYKFSKKVAEKR
jgi:hypothetical protein